MTKQKPTPKTLPKLTVAQQQYLLRSMTQTAAAKLVGKPAVWLRDNAHVDGRNADGTYDVVALVGWMLKQADQGDKLALRKQELALEREEINAERDRFELNKKKGQLVDADEVVSTVAAILATFRERLNGIADKIAPSLSEDSARVAVPIIKREVARHLTWLSEELDRKTREPSGK